MKLCLLCTAAITATSLSFVASPVLARAHHHSGATATLQQTQSEQAATAALNRQQIAAPGSIAPATADASTDANGTALQDSTINANGTTSTQGSTKASGTTNSGGTGKVDNSSSTNATIPEVTPQNPPPPASKAMAGPATQNDSGIAPPDVTNGTQTPPATAPQ